VAGVFRPGACVLRLVVQRRSRPGIVCLTG